MQPLLGVVMLTLLSVVITIQAYTTLKTSVDRPCNDEVMSFICVTSGAYMYWRITPHRESNYRSAEEETFLLSLLRNIQTWHNVSAGQIDLHFRVNQYSPTGGQADSQGMNITLMLMVNRDLNGALIICEGDQQKQHTVTIADRPGSPVDIRIIDIEHFFGPLDSWAQVELHWDEGGGRVDGYHVNTTSGHVSSINTTERSATITNVSYDGCSITTSIVAINCGSITSNVAFFVFNITTCTNIQGIQSTMSSNTSRLITIFSVDNETINSADIFIVDSIINYHCKEGYVPADLMTSVCRADGAWFPDPTLHMCIKNQSSTVGVSMPGDLKPGKSTTETTTYKFNHEDGFNTSPQNNNIILIGSAVGASTFLLFCVICGLVCISVIIHKYRARSAVTNLNVPDVENIYDHPIYEEIRPRIGMQMEENAAYECLVVVKIRTDSDII